MDAGFISDEAPGTADMFKDTVRLIGITVIQEFSKFITHNKRNCHLIYNRGPMEGSSGETTDRDGNYFKVWVPCLCRKINTKYVLIKPSFPQHFCTFASLVLKE